MPVSHLFVSVKPDDADTSLIRPSNWNDNHVITSIIITDPIGPIIGGGNPTIATNKMLDYWAGYPGVFLTNEGDVTPGFVNFIANSSFSNLAGGFFAMRSGGTPAAPTKVTNGMSMLAAEADGWVDDDQTFYVGGSLLIQASEDWTGASGQGTKFEIRLNPNADVANTYQRVLGVSGAGELDLPKYTSNGFLKTSGSNGTVIVDTTTYGNISGTGVVGQVAEFVTDTSTLQAAKLIGPASNILTITNAAASTLALNITSAKTLTLTAADNYTLTIPATGTVALLATANVFTAAQAVTVADAGTNTATTLATLTHNSSGTPAAGFGTRLLFNLDSATVDDRSAVAIDAIWLTATDASRQGGLEFYIAVNGTLTRVGFFTGSSFEMNQNFGPKLMSSGVTNAPLYRFKSDDDTGMGRSGSDILGLWTGGLERLQIGATGTSLFSATSTITNAIVEGLRLTTTVSTASTGSANGFGTGLSWYAETATDGTNQQQALIASSWIDATNASRKAKLSLSAYDTAARLGIEIEASGTVVKLGFFGGTTAVQQALNAYTSDGEGAAYTGIDNLQVGTVYATVADLNQLRVAYETLRASYDDLRTKLQTSTIVA